MTTDAWITLGVILAVLALLVRGRVSPAVVVFGGAVAVLVLGVIEADAAFSGFSNSAPITVAALYVLAAGIEKTGALTPVMQRTLGERGGWRVDGVSKRFKEEDWSGTIAVGIPFESRPSSSWSMSMYSSGL